MIDYSKPIDRNSPIDDVHYAAVELRQLAENLQDLAHCGFDGYEKSEVLAGIIRDRAKLISNALEGRKDPAPVPPVAGAFEKDGMIHVPILDEHGRPKKFD